MTFTSEENKKALTDLVRAFEMSPLMEKISLLQPDSVFVMDPTDSYWKVGRNYMKIMGWSLKN